MLEIEQAKDISEYERKVQELEELHEKGDIDILYYLQLKRALTVLPKPRISRSGSAHVSDYVQLRNAGLSHKFISIYLNCSLSYLLHLSWTEYYKKHFNQALYNENKIVI
ncbi:hypothetical protein MCOL2_05915 [Listeria fleischmannii FSL S10-1203]|uniref:Uncharacterized protein n=1 Tax=Listeria fleischmannii FSL S10-1203 TaxID=1265822 RepID=W7DUP7_9LIST|nr:hypothetical protein MCOL2_05915 [Listeria fleischmannii FSL S10-1203]